MNLSGKAVRFWMELEKIPMERILVIADDLNLPFEKIRLRGKGSDGGHNGLKDIQTVLGSTVYPRLRIGIGDKFSTGQQINHVLGEWTKEEELILQEMSVRSQKAVESFCAIGLERSMNSVNTDI